MHAPGDCQQPATALPPALPGRCTVIGRDVALACGIESTYPVLVEGRVAGGVESPWVEVAAGGSVSGKVVAQEAFITGCTGGPVYADIVSLDETARVGGEVVCRKLYMAPGAAVQGRTFPSARLTRRHAAALARIARDARAAENTDPGILGTLFRDGLVFRGGGAVFVSLPGRIELGRRWARGFGMTPGLVRRARGRAACPPDVKLARAAALAGGRPVSVIADDVTVEGNMETGGDLRVCGDVRGSLRCHTLCIGDASRVEGPVRASEVSVRGRVCGDVSAVKVLLHTTARIGGTVTFAVIDVRGGARYVEGRQAVLPGNGLNGMERLAPPAGAAAAIESCLAEIPAAA